MLISVNAAQHKEDASTFLMLKNNFFGVSLDEIVSLDPLIEIEIRAVFK